MCVPRCGALRQGCRGPAIPAYPPLPQWGTARRATRGASREEAERQTQRRPGLLQGYRDLPLADAPMLEVLRRASESVFVPLTVGGGIRDFTDSKGVHYDALAVAAEYFRSGADKARAPLRPAASLVLRAPVPVHATAQRGRGRVRRGHAALRCGCGRSATASAVVVSSRPRARGRRCHGSGDWSGTRGHTALRFCVADAAAAAWADMRGCLFGRFRSGRTRWRWRRRGTRRGARRRARPASRRSAPSTARRRWWCRSTRAASTCTARRTCGTRACAPPSAAPPARSGAGARNPQPKHA